MPKICVESRCLHGKISAPLVTTVRKLLSTFCLVPARALKSFVFLVSHFLAATVFSATLVWDANRDAVTAGYRVYAKSGLETLTFDVGARTSLPLDFVKPGKDYQFHVVAYSFEGLDSDPSDVLEYNVPIPFGWPTLLMQPVSVAVSEGSNVFLVVQTAGIGVRFQWLKNGKELDGATNIFLSIPSVTSEHVGRYSVRVANVLGEVESEAAQLSLLTPPTIVHQDHGAHVRAGDPILLSVEASGTDPLTYRWMKGSELVQEGDDPLLFLSASSRADAGSYTVVVSNEFGSVSSDPIEVVVDAVQPPSVRIQRSDAGLFLVIQGYPATIYVIETLSALEQSAWIRYAEIETDEQGNAIFPLNPEMESVQLFRILET